MRETKSIEKTLKLLIASSIGFFIILFLLKSFFSTFEFKFLLFAIFLINSLVLVIISYPKRAKKILITLLFSIIIYLPLFLYFRQVRNFFPKPALAGSDWIGFANYFGYPLYFDNFLVLLLILIPIMIYLGIRVYENKKS